MKFYKRDPDRALAGMNELTLKQRGAYNSILDLLYSRDGDVPDDDTRVARMISCHWREWKAVKLELIDLGKIWVEDGLICARRVQETLKEASDFSQDQSKRASKGWQKRKKDREINNPPMPPGNALTPIDTPIDRNKKNTKKKSGNHINKPDTIPKQLWDDFLTLRDKKKAPVSQIAWNGICREAERAQLTPAQAITLQCERGWQGFNADWVKQEDRQALSLEPDKPPTEMITMKNGKTAPRSYVLKRAVSYFERKAGGEMNGHLWSKSNALDDMWPPDHRDSVYPDEIVSEAKSITRN
jgi:uncharacterized protein YdaU (DUF1376 family)